MCVITYPCCNNTQWITGVISFQTYSHNWCANIYVILMRQYSKTMNMLSCVYKDPHRRPLLRPSQKADGSGRHVKVFDCTGKADPDVEEGRRCGPGPLWMKCYWISKIGRSSKRTRVSVNAAFSVIYWLEADGFLLREPARNVNLPKPMFWWWMVTLVMADKLGDTFHGKKMSK